MSPATSRQYPKTATGLAVAALVSIVLAFYQGLWLPGLVLIKRDAFRYFLPLKQYLIERLSAGELPQWFPYEALGRPFIGATVTGVFHPFTALYFFFIARRSDIRALWIRGVAHREPPVSVFNLHAAALLCRPRESRP